MLTTDKHSELVWPNQALGQAADLVSKPQNKPRITRRMPPPKRGIGRFLGLMLAGLCCFALLTTLAAIIWGYIEYSRLGYILETGPLPGFIFFGLIFLCSCLITAIGRGGAIFPTLCFTLLATVLTCLLAQLPSLSIVGLLLKLLYALLCATAGFTLTKLILIR